LPARPSLRPRPPPTVRPVAATAGDQAPPAMVNNAAWARTSGSSPRDGSTMRPARCRPHSRKFLHGDHEPPASFLSGDSVLAATPPVLRLRKRRRLASSWSCLEAASRGPSRRTVFSGVTDSAFFGSARRPMFGGLRPTFEPIGPLAVTVLRTPLPGGPRYRLRRRVIDSVPFSLLATDRPFHSWSALPY
jgi:hypothetical protein